MKRILEPLALLTSNWIGTLGVLLTTTGAMLWLFMLPTMLRGETVNPYMGIVAFVFLPAVFFAGLALIPLGWWWNKRAGRVTQPRSVRSFAIFLAVTTGANLLIGSQFTYRAIHHMESTEFCGLTCHTVMEPEYVAHANSPHAEVPCTACHVGEGADWFIKSKLAGTRQLISLTTNSYSKPIPTPVHNLREANETCERCHWRQKNSPDRLRRIPTFADDEANSRTETVLLMHVGGAGSGRGIHGAHLGGVVIRYRPGDEHRQTIPWVELEKGGKKEVFIASAAKPGDAEKLEMRTMGCMDCHSRPSHTFEMPERALHTAMDRGQITPSLPFAKKQALELLKASYPSSAAATQQITEKFKGFYKEKYAALASSKQAEIDQSANEVAAIWKRNVFPVMKVTWGTYPNHLGHTDSTGCFRCHDADHNSKEGKSIQQDCNACHQLLATDETNPKILADLGFTAAK